MEVEDEEDEEEEEEEEDEDVPVVVEVVRPAWMEMEPMKGGPPEEDLPSKGTTNWGDEDDGDCFCCCWC